jgi:hypothetical protein
MDYRLILPLLFSPPEGMRRFITKDVYLRLTEKEKQFYISL